MQQGLPVSSWLRCLCLALAGCLTLAATARAQTEGPTPVAVIAATGYNELLTDIDYLGRFGGQVKAGQQLNNMLLLFTQNKGLAGVDKTKAWGAVVQVNGMEFVPVVCLPVTDYNALLQLPTMFQMTTSDVGDGITEIEIPNQSLYVKNQGGWAFLAQSAESLASVPADPGAMFDAMTTDYDVFARVMVQNIPEMYRSIAIEQMRAGAEQEMQQKEGESDDDYQSRRKMAEANIEEVVKLINETDELSIGLDTDSDNGGVLLDFLLGGVEGSNMAKQIAAYQGAQTQFAGCLRDDAAVRFNMTMTTPPELLADSQAQVKGQMQTMRQQLMTYLDEEADLRNDEDRATVKDAAGDLMDALEATALAGKLDMAGHADIREGAFSVVAGGFALDTAKIESALKKVATLVEDKPDFPGVQWNADSHAGAAIHTMSIPVPEDKDEARALFGETMDIALAIGNEVVYFAAGDGSVSYVKQAMDSTGSEAVKPAQFSLALTPLMQFGAQAESNPVTDAMIDALVTKSDGKDQVHMSLDTVSGKLRGRMEIEKGVLEAMGAAAMQARRQGAAAGF